MNTYLNRRRFLKQSFTTAGLLALASPVTRALAESCGLTPPQTPGPFYPGENLFHQDNDLTQVPGHASQAKGQLIYVNGRVVDENCKPIAGATVEIWQACASGRYNNPTDTNPALLDPDFKYWAETTTDSNGEYSFKTIIPGAYPADTNWIRPPHIHFKVSRLGFTELITQMYFMGNPLNDKDLILQKLKSPDQQAVIVDFTPTFIPDTLKGFFEITLQSV